MIAIPLSADKAIKQCVSIFFFVRLLFCFRYSRTVYTRFESYI
jgi:hypothetical protein